MDEYISREAVLSHSEIIQVYSKDYGNIDVVPVEYLADIPAADVQLVKRGRWVLSDDKNWVTCPFCDADVDVSVGILVYVDNEEVNHINFCPNCGAKMDGESE